MYKNLKSIFIFFFIFFLIINCSKKEEKRIIRIGHNQSLNHPTHKGMEAFKKFIEEKLGDKYDIRIFPSELLGSQNDMVQLTQTGAIDFVVASNSIMETFEPSYKIFNLPYLFSSSEVYHAVMDDEKITAPIYNSTQKVGFQVVTWLDAGTRNFYTIKKPVNSPSDLKGLKIRVQKSPTNIEMMKLLGGSATPMGFGEVYTALQSNILDGAENNEMALTENGHGEISKFYSYDSHQMVPDLVLGNTVFLKRLPDNELKIFQEGFKIINKVQRKEWKKAVEKAKKKAETEQGVKFNYPDIKPFKEAVLPLHQKILKENPGLKSIYEQIQEKNQNYSEKNNEVKN